jgi:hypothetical protein
VGFGGECGNSRAARADGAGVWVWNRRAEQLARMERDLVAHTTALGTADAAKWVWVKRRDNCSTQPRATISTSMSAGPCGRSVTESCRAASALETSQSPNGILDFPGFTPWLQKNGRRRAGAAREGAAQAR